MDETRPPVERTSQMAIASFVLGLCSFLCTCLTGLPGLILGILAVVGISSSGGSLRGMGLAITGIVTSSIGLLLSPFILLALLLPAVQAAREAGRRSECTNNLRQIGIGLHNQIQAQGHFPAAATLEADGGPPRSWRVDSLPYIEQQSLHAQYDPTEAWDGPKNSALLDRRPLTYRCPSNNNPSVSDTDYAAVTGAHALFPIAGDGPPLVEVPDGLSNTLAVVEGHRLGIAWTEPRDVEASQLSRVNASDAGLSSAHPGGCTVLMADGSVRFVSESVPEDVLRAMATRDGAD